MSCQENCEAVSELSGVPSVTFGGAGSWCLPGAAGPTWGLCRAQQAAEARVTYFHSASVTFVFCLYYRVTVVSLFCISAYSLCL